MGGTILALPLTTDIILKIFTKEFQHKCHSFFAFSASSAVFPGHLSQNLHRIFTIFHSVHTV